MDDKKKSGLVGFSFALPNAKISLATIAKKSNQDPSLFSGLGINTRTHASVEENTFTLCARAGYKMLQSTNIKKELITYCLLGTETPLYSVNPTSSMLAGLLQFPETAQMFDMEFACKSGTAGMQMVLEIMKYKKKELGVVFAGDIGSGTPGDALEYTAGAAATCMVFGNAEEYPVLATMEHMTTLNRNRMDFWKGKGAPHPQHAGRWSNEVYEETLVENVQNMLAQIEKKIDYFDHVVLHMPNGKLPMRVAKKLDITPKQLRAGWVVAAAGNSYSACVPLGLCSVLSVAKPNENILVLSYGSGAGSDAFWFQVTQEIQNYPRPSVLEALAKLPLIEDISSLKTL